MIFIKTEYRLEKIQLSDIEGYSQTEERTNYVTKNGVLVYLKNGKHVDFSEINIRNITSMVSYFEKKGIPNYGSETLRPWFFTKYKYDKKY